MDRSTPRNRRIGRRTVANGLRAAATAIRIIGRAIRGRLPTAGGGQALPAFLVVLVVFWPVAGAAGAVAVASASDAGGTVSDTTSASPPPAVVTTPEAPVPARTTAAVGSPVTPWSATNGIPSTGIWTGTDGVDDTLLQGSSFPHNGSGDINSEFHFSVNGRTVTFDAQPVVESFEGTVTNVSAVEWTFGDGVTGNGTQTTHTYSSGGFYRVEYRVCVDRENASSVCATGGSEIAVGPGAAISVSPSQPTIDDTIRFDATGTPVPANATAVVYDWEGSGTSIDNLTGATPTWEPSNLLSEPFYSRSFFPSPEVRLTVHVTTPSWSKSYVERTFVTVATGNGTATGDGPVARFTVVPERGTATRPMRFEANVSDPANVSTYEWSFGDGTTATGREVRHPFDAAGNYTVELTVTDDAGLIDTATKTVRVESSPVQRYDTDDDGLELEEMHTALDDFENATAGGETNGTAGNVTLEDTRQILEEFAHNASDIDPPEFEPNGTDTDGDGLSDDLELNGVPVLKTAVTDDTDLVASSTGDGDRIVRVNTDRKKSDTDGDGLSDAVELGQKRNLTTGTGDTTIETDTIYYAFNSDPTDGKSADTDDDGLPDKLEKRGIPVRKTYNLTDHQSEAFDNADVNGTTDVGREKLQTDPSDPDTDGDGLRDGEEVGKRIEGPVGFYYTLVSDPTDANTDDAGIDDGEEMKKGSDPTFQESFSVSAIFPVLGKRACDPVDEADDKKPINKCARRVATTGSDDVYELKALEEHRHTKELVDVEGLPKWLDDIDDSKINSGRTYYLVRVAITGEGNVSDTTNLPTTVDSIGFGTGTVVGMGTSKDGIDDVESESVSLFTSGESGSATVYLAVKGPRPGASSIPAKYVVLGSATITISIPKGPYARGQFRGHEERTIRSKSQFVVNDTLPRTSPETARAMVREATRKFAQNVAATVVPVNAGALSASTFKILSNPGAAAAFMVANEGVALFTGIKPIPAIGPDDLIGKAVAGEGAVPHYLRGKDDARPTGNVAVTLYRAN